MSLTIPDFCLVLLIGPSGSGKSTFARRHFKATEVISSDTCRGLVSDDENDQSATGDAFDLVHFIAAKRMAARRLTVIDATNVRSEDRRALIALAKRFHALTVGFVFNMPRKLCDERNALRPDRQFGPHVVRNHLAALRRSLRGLGREGIRYVYRFDAPEEADAAEIERVPLWTDRRGLSGPFDIIGDVHGCAGELEQLLTSLGYAVRRSEDPENGPSYDVTPPEGRTALFLGDLVDRGPRTPDVLRLVMGMVEAGTGHCILGNHEAKLLRKLNGRNVKIAHGLAETLEQLAAEPPAFSEKVAGFIDGLISHFWLDQGRLAVAHAGLQGEMMGRSSGAVRAFALYGETTGETDEFGLPVRYNWAKEYRGQTKIVYGHTPVPEAEWLNGTICIDTGCVFGGKLTALRYPEMELVSVPAAEVYCEPMRRLAPPAAETGPLSAQQEHDSLLHLEDVSGKRILTTGFGRSVTVHEENAAAALEVMSRFAVDPRWLIYLPPTMSPSETSERDGFLEHPAEAFAHYRAAGVEKAVCEEKHMGSRAVLVVCRDREAARRRFGLESDNAGVIFTRTGRPFFPDGTLEAEVLERLRQAMTASGFWAELETDWACIDAELMPWSLKAETLLRNQYAAMASAARQGLDETVGLLERAAARGVATSALAADFAARRDMVADYTAAYRHYCWPVASIADVKLAPFHLLATEGAVHSDKDNVWHMETLAKIARQDEAVLIATPYKLVDLADAESEAEATAWWSGLTEAGGEGMVVKPFDFVHRTAKGPLQPAVKCRGREYLRIIYGPEYSRPEHLARLRQRGLGKKRSLAMREFALGLTALERFVAGEPLRRVHECVFGVLALESEPVDPRL